MLGLLAANSGFAQSKPSFFQNADTLHKGRVWGVGITTGVGYSATMIGLNELWYNDYPRSEFHFYNDNDAWMGMDKLGHALTAYQVGRYGYGALNWAGVKKKPAVWIGGNLGLFFLTSVEILDGTSAEWGFSPGDAIANLGGAALFIGQQLAWDEQRIQLKFSYSASPYAEMRPETLGSGGVESVLKDYNGQTIWMSVTPSAFSNRERKFLPWLSVSLGYSANGMLGGSSNPDFDDSGVPLPSVDRYRQYLLSLDVDASKIPVRSPALKTIFSVIGFIKFPAPALEFSQEKLTWHWMYF